MKVLVAGIGNIFEGDDGFGCEVAQRLSRCELGQDVDVVDFGIRGMDLGYALMDGCELAILVDTVDRGNAPGTLHVIEPDFADMPEESPDCDEPLIAPHDMAPDKVLRLVASLGTRRPRVLMVACQPERLGGEHGHMGLSTAVEAAVDGAVREVQDIIAALPRHAAMQSPDRQSLSA